MKVNLTRKIQVVGHCCNCEEATFSITHLLNELKEVGQTYSFGPWVCDQCLYQSKGVITKIGENLEDVELELELGKPYCYQYDLLKLEPQKEPVYFLIRGEEPIEEGIDIENLTYRYEMHSCPTNFIRCEEIISEGDNDPHGLFTYVGSVRPSEVEEEGRLPSNMEFHELNKLLGGALSEYQ